MNGEQGPAIAMTKCFFCNKDNAIVMQTRNIMFKSRHVEEMHGKIVDMTPCSQCKEFMRQGIILITIDPAKSSTDWHKPPGNLTEDQRRHWMPNPYRTGGSFVLKDKACERFMQPREMYDWAAKNRWMFIEHEAAEKLGLFEAAKTAPTTP